MYVCMYVCMCVRACVHACAHAYVRACMYVCPFENQGRTLYCWKWNDLVVDGGGGSWYHDSWWGPVA